MTGRPCTVCNHPMVDRIDEALVLRSPSVPKIADKYDLHGDALRRHRGNHIGEDKKRQIVLNSKVAEEQAVANAINDETVEVKSGLKRIVC
jgi:hypothetical protein